MNNRERGLDIGKAGKCKVLCAVFGFCNIDFRRWLGLGNDDFEDRKMDGGLRLNG